MEWLLNLCPLLWWATPILRQLWRCWTDPPESERQRRMKEFCSTHAFECNRMKNFLHQCLWSDLVSCELLSHQNLLNSPASLPCFMIQKELLTQQGYGLRMGNQTCAKADRVGIFEPNGLTCLHSAQGVNINKCNDFLPSNMFSHPY